MRTLLLCFIHGFKGGDDTFSSFPEHLRAIISHSLPKVNVRTIIYPRYDTRGDLAECVKEFIEWLFEKVTDLEASNGTPSNSDRSTRVILIGHSMGGIVAADAVLALASDTPFNSVKRAKSSYADNRSTPIIPHIQGVLAFDTPYHGISAGVLTNFNPSKLVPSPQLIKTLWEFNRQEHEECPKSKIKAGIPRTPSAEAFGWQNWGKIAIIAGVTTALAVGGSFTAYLKRDSIKQGCSWIGSHLEFVGCLMKGDELLKRNHAIKNLSQNHAFGFGNIYTCLGKRSAKSNDNLTAKYLNYSRTFCILPKPDDAEFWHESVNDAAIDELNAHISMFHPRENSDYYSMCQRAKDLIIFWTTNEWSSTSTGVY